ncbi:MAG: pyridoxamine 5-phosphate oxidase-related FMN-bin ding protein [Naasia sp.]|nr:pyridoxamine 5-phosphate oxidase-related FMN-bin ding protein [Naasia sp.]
MLGRAAVGRLAVSVAGVPDIFPVSFLVDRGTLLFRTSPGTKLLELTINKYVAVEIDGIDGDEAWSVVLRGIASRLERKAELAHADSLALSSWQPMSDFVYVCVAPMTVTGRRLRREPRPALPRDGGRLPV